METTIEQTEQQQILSAWADFCKEAMKDCPSSFLPKFSSLMFRGSQLMTEMRVVCEANALRDAVLGKVA